jgi:hypothetical protein
VNAAREAAIRLFPGCVLLLAGLLLSSCADDEIGPDSLAAGRSSLRPEFGRFGSDPAGPRRADRERRRGTLKGEVGQACRPSRFSPEPACFLRPQERGWWRSRPDTAGLFAPSPHVTCPGKISCLGRAVVLGDTVPPARVSDLSVTEAGANWARLAWTAPGDDGTEEGPHASIRFWRATRPFEWDQALPVWTPAPDSAEPPRRCGREACGKAGPTPSPCEHADEASNWSAISNRSRRATGLLLNPTEIDFGWVFVVGQDGGGYAPNSGTAFWMERWARGAAISGSWRKRFLLALRRARSRSRSVLSRATGPQDCSILVAPCGSIACRGVSQPSALSGPPAGHRFAPGVGHGQDSTFTLSNHGDESKPGDRRISTFLA